MKEVDLDGDKELLYVLNKGVEQGKKEMLNKVCDWLKDNAIDYMTYIISKGYESLNVEKMIEDLCKEMEE